MTITIASIERGVSAARRALQIEAAAVSHTGELVEADLAPTLKLLSESTGRVVVSGLGKSGHIGRKIAATLASTGTPAQFVHASEALHGDSGMAVPGDVGILISYSGTTAELCQFASMLRQRGIDYVAFTSRRDSPLAQDAAAFCSIAVEREADPLGLAPTASTATTLAIGDALASGLMAMRGFAAEQFGQFHPGGALGQALAATTGSVR